MIEKVSSFQAIEGFSPSLPVNEPKNGLFEQLVSGVESVNELQQESGQVKADYISGTEGVGMLDVMVATSSASVAFTGLVEVRNKVQEAYSEIMNMAI